MKTWRFAAMAMVLAVAYASAAGANDGKFYNDHECTEVSGGGAIVCPIIRDNVQTNPGINSIKAWVVGAGGQTITCSAYALNRDGTTQNSTSASTSANGFQALDVPAPATTGNGSAYLGCILPSGTSFHGYYVEEL